MLLDAILDMKGLAEGEFRAPTPSGGWRRPFGGHLLGQALVAACRTVEAGKVVHNMQTQFLRSGRSGCPIDYHVETLRDGSRFATRQVTAVQEGRTLTESLLSFHVREEGLDFQPPFPDVPAPDGLPSEQRLRHEAAAIEGVEWCMSPILPDLPVELRPVQARDFIAPPRLPGRLDFWLRANQPVTEENGYAFAACVSDIMLLSAALLPHGISWATTPVEGSTLNHVLWFHHPVPASAWLLWSMDVQWTGATRGLVHGSLWSEAGTLVATAVQEGLVRLK